MYAVPGERGPPFAPMTPSVASVTLISSDSNHSSKNSTALCVKILTSPTISLGLSPRNLRGELQIIDEIAQALRRELGRRGQQQAFHHLRKPLQMVLVGGKHRCIVPRELRDFIQRLRAILPHEEMAAVGKGREERRVLGVHAIAEARQFQIANHALLQKAR